MPHTETSAVDYLLKPVDDKDLVHAVSLFEKQRTSKNYSLLKENLHSYTKKIALSTSSSILFVPLEDILFLKAEGSYTHVFLKSGDTILTSKNLKHHEDTLCLINQFYRCHKSFIINIHHITEYVKSDGGYLKIGTHIISVSSEKISSILAQLKL